MSAFKGAVDVGIDALETDVHLSKDGVVVLSHVSTSLTKTRQAIIDLIEGSDLTTMFWH